MQVVMLQQNDKTEAKTLMDSYLPYLENYLRNYYWHLASNDNFFLMNNKKMECKT